MMKLAKDNPTVDTKYAAVSYSSSAVVDFQFLPYSLAANRIMQVRYVGWSTNTEDGLAKAKGLFLDRSSGRYFLIVLLVDDLEVKLNLR